MILIVMVLAERQHRLAEGGAHKDMEPRWFELVVAVAAVNHGGQSATSDSVKVGMIEIFNLKVAL
ncbi:hypothetical protein E5D57_006217 [Metarhizium anisopliae]|nr:hypothetical protein E5D57_006217 [Metarhizium anisopliae]